MEKERNNETIIKLGKLIIRERNKEKSLILRFNKLKIEINKELVKESRTFNDSCKKSLVLGKNHACLLTEILDRSWDDNCVLDCLDSNYMKKGESELRIYGKQVYVTSQDDVIMLISNLSDSIDDLCTGFSVGSACKNPSNQHLTNILLEALLENFNH